jgi:hypothetical protein
MILGSPYNLFSWNYLLKGEGHLAYWEKRWTSEQCSILIDDVLFEVEKHGVTSGYWTLQLGEMVYASAQKQSVWRRSFEIESPMGHLQLVSNGILRHSFTLGRDGEAIATIYPRNIFTRKAEVDILVDEYDFPTMTLVFWLVILTWRRQRRS